MDYPLALLGRASCDLSLNWPPTPRDVLCIAFGHDGFCHRSDNPKCLPELDRRDLYRSEWNGISSAMHP
jgi:hypothetical protein